MSEIRSHSERSRLKAKSDDEVKRLEKPLTTSAKSTTSVKDKGTKGEGSDDRSSSSKLISSMSPVDKNADFGPASQSNSINTDSSAHYVDAVSIEQPMHHYMTDTPAPGSYAYSWFQYQLYNYYVAAAAVAAASGNTALISPISLPSPVDHRLSDQYFSSHGNSTDDNCPPSGHSYHQNLHSQNLHHHSPTSSSSSSQQEAALHDYPSPVDFTNYNEYAPYFYSYPYSASVSASSGKRPSMVTTGYGQFPASPKMSSGQYNDTRSHYMGRRGSESSHNVGSLHSMPGHPEVSHLGKSMAKMSMLDTTSNRREPFSKRDSPDTSLSASNQYSFFYPRGPPKKPPQSGYALWVGNLPGGSTLGDLLQLFGTQNIQSIFLIERTNCAFVNYLNQSSVENALEIIAQRGPKIRDNILVVKRQEKDAASSNNFTTQDKNSALKASHGPAQSASFPKRPSSPSSSTSGSEDHPENRYFICKSLTHEDLQASAAIGVWATQSQNVQKFNDAFKVSSTHCSFVDHFISPHIFLRLIF